MIGVVAIVATVLVVLRIADLFGPARIRPIKVVYVERCGGCGRWLNDHPADLDECARKVLSVD